METREFIVHDRVGQFAFKGRILSDCRYGANTRKPRWTDMALYQVDDSEDGYCYLWEVAARSRVYHKINGGKCTRERHLRTSVGDLKKIAPDWPSLVPCHLCNPGALATLDDRVRIAREGDDPSAYPCVNAQDIVKRIYREKGEISHLAAQMLREAAENDPEIKRALKAPRRL